MSTMHVLNLPQDTISEIIDIIYEPPFRNTNIRLGSNSLSTFRWQKGNNKTIYDLSLVCKALAVYTSPFRHRLRQQLISTRKGMLEKLSEDESLRQSVRYLTINVDDLTLPFSSPLPNLFALDVNQFSIDTKFLTWIASCVNLRHLTLRAIYIDQAMVPALADLRLSSLHIHVGSDSSMLPVQTIFSGQSSHSLQQLIVYDFQVQLSILFPATTTLRHLKSLYLVRTGYEQDALANLSYSMPNLETLAVDLISPVAVDPDASGSWPNLKCVYINYFPDYPKTKTLHINAPLLSEFSLQGVEECCLNSFSKAFSPHQPSTIRVLTLDLLRNYGNMFPSVDTIRDLGYALVHLEVLTLTLTALHVYETHRKWEELELMDANADSLAVALEGFHSLRVLDWGVGIPSFGDVVDYLSPQWIKRHTPLYEKLIVSIGNACPRMAEVKWAMSGEKRWIADNFVRGDDGSVSDLDLELSEYNFLDRYAYNFPMFTTLS